MKNVRIIFEKKGSARFISHLDLTHCMSRALKLSRLPVWYTEGFNPRIYMTFAMPLSLGIDGERECMDIRLTESPELSEIPARLNAHLPKDIRVLGAQLPEKKLEETALAEYEFLLETEDPEGLKASLEALFSKNEILVPKHTKKGEKEFDIKPGFADMRMEPAPPEGLKIGVTLPCSPSGSVNPGLLPEAVKRYLAQEPYAKITRKRLLTKDFLEICAFSERKY